MKPIAFMVMPFGEKATNSNVEGVPSEVDFDALWRNVYYPVLAEDYMPVRADEDFGALILLDMIQRLAAADVVVADITVPNANVYYEIGVRHAARDGGCVLVGADWAETRFDLAQIRRIPFPLTEGNISESGAEVARNALRGAVVEAAGKDKSPVFQAVPNFPEHEASTLDAFREFAQQMAGFHAKIRAIALAPPGQRSGLATALAEEHRGPISKGVAYEIVRLLRDNADWSDTTSFIESLDDPIRNDPRITEQYWLAVSGRDDHAVAAAGLESLIETVGPSAERFGLLGGRYKRLLGEADKDGDEIEAAKHLDASIAAYERGMELDLNEYYCSSNLPRLLRRRNDPGDDAEATRAEGVTFAACRRALARGDGDEWLRPTFLNVAFDLGDVDEAQRLFLDVRKEGHAKWKLKSCLDDLRTSAAQHPDEVATALHIVADNLEVLIPADADN